jgi:hypothetical protein
MQHPAGSSPGITCLTGYVGRARVSTGSQSAAGPSAAPASSGGAPAPTASADGDLAIPADADEETRKQYVEENAMAACMRAKGLGTAAD